MTPFLPVEDPSDRDSLTDRSVAYVRANPLLKIVFWTTVANHLLGLGLVFLGLLAPAMEGFFLVMTLCAWFFAVAVPVMNREVRFQIAGSRRGYWSEMVEMFARVLLCALTGMHTVLLVQVALG